MIKEFAIEPEVMANWENFRLLFPDFGVGKGRLIARYRKDWAKDVQSLISRLEAKSLLGSVKAKSMLEQIFTQKHKFIPARRDYEPGKDWLRNAESARRFDAIIATENPRHSTAVIDIKELDKDDSRYKAPVQMKVPRTANALAGCAKLLLNVCEEILLVEPHFDPNERRFRETFLEILAMRADAPQQLKRFEIHTKKPREFRPDVLKANYQPLEKRIPQGTTLKVFFWSQKNGGEKLHPRFLLTEFGGLKYDYGLDVGESREESSIVDLLDHDLWQTLRTDYSESGTTFELSPDAIFEVPGKQA